MSTKTRMWVLVTGVLCALVVLYGFLAGLVPQLSDASRIRSVAESTSALNETQQLQLTMLQQSEQESDQLAEQLAELQVAIPARADWERFLRELQAIEAATGARVTEIMVEPTILPEPAATDPAVPAEDSAEPVAETPANAGAAATSDPAAPAPVSGLIELPLTISVGGDGAQVVEFMRQLQAGERLFVSRSMEFSTTESGSTAVSVGSIYILV